MNFGGEFSTPVDEDFRSIPPWVPVTPQKPLPLKPHHVLLNPHGNHLQENWRHDLGNVQSCDTYNGMRQAISPQFPGNVGVYGIDGGMAQQYGTSNHIAGYYSQLPSIDSSSWNTQSFTQLLLEDNETAIFGASGNRSLSRSVEMAANAPRTPHMHLQVANQRNNSSSFLLTNLHYDNGSYRSCAVTRRPVVADFPSQYGNNIRGQSNVANWLLNNENHCSSSNLLNNGDSSAPISQYVFPMPMRPMYDLNSLPTEANTTSSVLSQLQFGVNKVQHLENNQLSAIQKSLTGESSSKDYEKQADLFMCTDALNSLPRTSSSTNYCISSQLQSTTNKVNLLENNNLSALQKSLTGETSSKVNNKEMGLFMSPGDVASQKHGGELLQSIVESASAGLSLPHEGNKDSDHEGDRDLDLNMTPEQKPPKRRKHRPKVITEGKPKRTPKSATPKNTEPKEVRTGKRKYVRKNIQKDSSSQPADGTSETRRNKAAGKGAKSCRRVLDFDPEKNTDKKKGKTVDQQEEMQQGNSRTFDVTFGFEGIHRATKTNHVSIMRSAEVIDLENEVTVESQSLGATSHMPSNCIILTEEQDSASPVVATRGPTQIRNLHVGKRHADNGFEYASMRHCSHAEGISKEAIQAKANGENREKTNEKVNQSACQSALKVMSSTDNLLSSLLCQGTFEVDGHHESSCTISKEIRKKQKVDDQCLSFHDIPCNVTAIDDRLGRKRVYDEKSNGFAAALNHTILNSYIGSSRMRESDETNCCTGDRLIDSTHSVHNLPKQQIPFKSNSCQEITQVMNISSKPTNKMFDERISSAPKKSSRRGKRQVLAKKQTVDSSILESAVSTTDKRLQEQNSVYDYQQSYARALEPSMRKTDLSYVDYIIQRFKGLSIDGSSNKAPDKDQHALVPYKGDGAVVPYEASEFIKKRKPRPKVELDSETNRIWNLLMGKEASEGTEGTDKQKEKYWKEEREVFQGRVDSFIARMHLVQGDRRFSRWKGSVVDSVIGVYLTQNVSDHLSSSAFMSLAARFPLKSVSNHQTQDKIGKDILVEEPEVCITIPDDATKWHEEIISQPINNLISVAQHRCAEPQGDGETSRIERNLMAAHSQLLGKEFVSSSQDSIGSSVTQGTALVKPYLVSNQEAAPTASRCIPNKVHSANSEHQLMDRAPVFQDFYNEVSGNCLFDEGSKHGHKQWGLKTKTDRMDEFSGTTFTNPINLDNRELLNPSVAPSSRNHLPMYLNSGEPEPWGSESFSEESISSCWTSTASRVSTVKEVIYKSLRNKELPGSVVNSSVEQNTLWNSHESATQNPYDALRQCSTDQQNYSMTRLSNEPSSNCFQHEGHQNFQLENISFMDLLKDSHPLPGKKNTGMQHVPNVNRLKNKSLSVGDSISKVNTQLNKDNGLEQISFYGQSQKEINSNISKGRKGKAESDKKTAVDWDNLRQQVQANGVKKERNKDAMDSLDYEALMNANVKEISNAIRERGMNNMLAERIQEFLNRVVKDHGSIDLEWLRDVPPDQAKDYLLSIRGLGLKSVECVRLLTLHHLAFPVDTNVGRIAVRLGWVPLQPLPESLQLHLLELYPMLETVQKYLWPRLCKLDQRTLYELHYQMITFGKVFCTKSKPNCNACPMRGECRHFASAFASSRLALPGPEEKSIVSSTKSIISGRNPTIAGNIMALPPPENCSLQNVGIFIDNCVPIIEEPATPDQEFKNLSESDMEDLVREEDHNCHEDEDCDYIPAIDMSVEQFTETLRNIMKNDMELQEGDMSKALVALNPKAAFHPPPKLKNVSRLRTEHQVYELPDSHHLLAGMDIREPDDPSPYLLAIWTPGETANSFQPPESRCHSQDGNKLCNEKTCFSCSSIREQHSQIVRGTILIPCRTAMRGSFPLNGTYFQVNEMFADHASSVKPIDVPTEWIWHLRRRTVYFGTSATSIFRGLTTEEIQYCFWRGYVCVRGFDRSTRAPKPLIARLHFPQSRMPKTKNEKDATHRGAEKI